MKTTLLAFVLAAAALAGCANAPLADADKQSLSRRYEGGIFYLRSSLNVMPFFADATKQLASPYHRDSILLLQDTQGAPILPGEVEAVIPFGRKVRIEKIELPTVLVVARRPLYTPRDNPWVYLTVPGTPRGRPYVVVLQARPATREGLTAAFNELFADDDPSVWLAKLTPEQRQAVEEKKLLVGMDPDSVSVAWGRPEKILQQVEEGVRVEQWTWPLGKRSAIFRDGKLASFAPPPEKAP